MGQGRTKVSVSEFRALLGEYGFSTDTVKRAQAQEVSAYYHVTIPAVLYKDKHPTEKATFVLTGEIAADVSHITRMIAPSSPAPEKKETVKAVESVQPQNDENLSTKIADIASSFRVNYFVPTKNKEYVKWSDLHDDVHSIIKSRHFFPVYITGLSGNGKTFTPEQVCSELKREIIRINFTEETSEDDLLGSFRLINGDTVWEDGPVVVALKRGAVLLLDELDLAGSRVMCLQSVLEGNGVYIKKVNQLVKPSEGFTVIATGNTKGKGDEGHGFVNTNFLNEAMLDRFDVTFEHDYPPEHVEIKILEKAYVSFVGKSPNTDDVLFFKVLAQIATMLRDSYKQDIIEGFLTTRRLVNIVKSYTVFNKDRIKAFNLATNRFDEETKDAMMTLYKTVDESIHPNNGQSDDLTPPETVQVEADAPF